MAPVDVLIQGDQALLVSPDGDAVQVGEEAVNDLLAEGFRPETLDESVAREEQESQPQVEYTSPVESTTALQAGGLAAARGITAGLSDPFLRYTGLVDPDTILSARQEHPSLSTALEVGGMVAPAILTGGAGLMAGGAAGVGRKAVAKGIQKIAGITPMGKLSAEGAKAGMKAAQAVARRGGGATAQRIAASTTAMGIEGAGIGTGQMLSRMAITGDAPDPSVILTGALMGGGFGLGSSAVGGAIRAGHRALAKRGYGKLPPELAVPGATPTVPGATPTADITTPPGPGITSGTMRAIPDAPPTVVSPGMPTTPLSPALRATERMSPAAFAETAVAPMGAYSPGAFAETAVAPMGAYSPGVPTARRTAVGVPPRVAARMQKQAIRRAERDAVKEAAPDEIPKIKAEAKRRIDIVDAETRAGSTTNPNMAAQMGAALGIRRRDIFYGALAGMWWGPKAALFAVGIRPAMKFVPGIARRAAKVSGKAAIVGRYWATQEMFDDYRKRLTPDAREETEERLREEEKQNAIALGVTPESAELGVQYKMAGLDLLAEKMDDIMAGHKEPHKKDARYLIAKPPHPTPGQRLRFGRYARAAEDIATVFNDYDDGHPTKEGVEVARALYPDELDTFQELARDAILSHGKLTKEQIRMANIMLEVQENRGYIDMIQRNFTASQQEQQQPPPSKQAALAMSHETHAQQAAKGVA